MKRSPVDSAAWDEFTRHYGLLIERCCQRGGVRGPDAQDLVQDVYAKLIPAIRKFQYDPGGGFRRWLSTVCRHAVYDFHKRERRRAQGTGDSQVARILAEVPSPEDAQQVLAETYDLDLFERAMTHVRRRVADHNWRAFVSSVLEGRTVEDTAQSLGLHVGMVYVARSKIIRMLSDEIQQLQKMHDS